MSLIIETLSSFEPPHGAERAADDLCVDLEKDGGGIAAGPHACRTFDTSIVLLLIDLLVPLVGTEFDVLTANAEPPTSCLVKVLAGAKRRSMLF